MKIAKTKLDLSKNEAVQELVDALFGKIQKENYMYVYYGMKVNAGIQDCYFIVVFPRSIGFFYGEMKKYDPLPSYRIIWRLEASKNLIWEKCKKFGHFGSGSIKDLDG